MDGGVASGTNIESALQKCLDLVGGDESKITVDILHCGSESLPIDKHPGLDNTISNYLRYRDMKKLYSGLDEIQEQKRAYPNANFRYLFEQENRMSGLEEVNFNNSTTWDLQMNGRE